MNLLKKLMVLSCAGLIGAQIHATLGDFVGQVTGGVTGSVKDVAGGVTDIVEPVPVVGQATEGAKRVVDASMDATHKVVNKTIAEPLGKEKEEPVKKITTREEPEDIVMEEENLEEEGNEE